MLKEMSPLHRVLRSPWLLRSVWLLAAGFLLMAAGLGSYGAYLATFLELPRSEDHPPLRLYTAPFQLKTGLSLKAARLPERLQRLGYRAVSNTVAAPGDYQLTPQALTIFLHAQPGKRRQQCWMNIHNTIGISFDEQGRQQPHETG